MKHRHGAIGEGVRADVPIQLRAGLNGRDENVSHVHGAAQGHQAHGLHVVELTEKFLVVGRTGGESSRHLHRRMWQHDVRGLTAAFHRHLHPVERERDIHFRLLRDGTFRQPRVRRRQRDGVAHRFGLARYAQHDGPPVGTERQALHFNKASWRGHLIAHDLIAGADDFKAIASTDVATGLDVNLLLRARPIGILQRFVKSDAEFIRCGGPRQHGLRRFLPDVTHAENLPRARRAGAPIGRAAMTREQQIALRRHARIDEQHAEAGDDLILPDVALGGFHELGAIQLAARFAAEQRVTAPVRGAERRPAIHALVEDHADGALMLRAVFHHRRLVDDLR